MDSDKDPKTNGFSFHFYKVYWPIIKSDMFHMVSAFQKKSKVGGCTNSTFLSLIPKEVNPSSFNMFHPISMCNGSYKNIIVTKRNSYGSGYHNR